MQKGFTLAETLITLAIIGVVAAITMPTLINNYQTKVWSTSSQVFERKLEDALKVMNSQEVLAGYSSTEDFVNEFKKHIKINKICNNNEVSKCFIDKITWNIIDISTGTESQTIISSDLKNSADLGHADWNTNSVGIQFSNGVSGIIAYNPNCTQNPYSNQVTGTNCIALVYDTTGFKSPNTFTKDIRGLNSYLGNCAFKDGSVCFGAPFFPDPVGKSDCDAKKDELGINDCYNVDDYWAGAANTCGGVNKMATPSQIAHIADYIYNTSGITGSTSNVVRDNERYNKLGFNETLYIMTNHEEPPITGPILTRGWRFRTDGINYVFTNRYDSQYAICLVE